MTDIPKNILPASLTVSRDGTKITFEFDIANGREDLSGSYKINEVYKQIKLCAERLGVKASDIPAEPSARMTFEVKEIKKFGAKKPELDTQEYFRETRRVAHEAGPKGIAFIFQNGPDLILDCSQESRNPNQVGIVKHVSISGNLSDKDKPAVAAAINKFLGLEGEKTITAESIVKNSSFSAKGDKRYFFIDAGSFKASLQKSSLSIVTDSVPLHAVAPELALKPATSELKPAQDWKQELKDLAGAALKKLGELLGKGSDQFKSVS